LSQGQITIFIPGSTAGITSIEYEPGLLKDIPEILDKISPASGSYHHNATWGDGNGHAHIRAALIGASFTVPFQNAVLMLGTWQQIVVMDFDNRSRQRQIIVQLSGE
jgi:secondary thiamine-phosphate synthase enzyme